jgi:hypothetical protein
VFEDNVSQSKITNHTSKPLLSAPKLSPELWVRYALSIMSGGIEGPPSKMQQHGEVWSVLSSDGDEGETAGADRALDGHMRPLPRRWGL